MQNCIKKIIVSLFILLSIHSSALVYDLILFYNEYDILEIRLNELCNVVDYFIIFEGAETFTGKPKPFLLEDYKKRYPEFAHKIIYHKNEGRFQKPIITPFEREWIQRLRMNVFTQYELKLKKNDIVIISDLDEIPRATTLKKAVQLVKNKKHPKVALEVTSYRHYLNRRLIKYEKVPLPVVTNFDNFMIHTSIGIRRLRDKVYCLKNGGWHFTSIHGHNDDAFVEKLDGMYRNQEQLGNREKILTIYKEKGKEAFSDWKEVVKKIKKYQLSTESTTVPIDGSYPKFVLDNLEKYRAKGYIDE